LKPNPINASVFNASLNDEGIADLVESIRIFGVQSPVQVRRSDNSIMDGHRRWLACGILGLGWIPCHLIDGVEAQEDIEDILIAFYTSNRDATVEERVNLYRLIRERISKTTGLKRGRPNKSVGIPPNCLTAEEIGEQAAKKSGLLSFDRAKRADKVFKDGDDELKAAMNKGELSVDAAYSRLTKPKKAKTAKTTATASTGADTSANSSSTGTEATTDATSDTTTASAKKRERKKKAEAEEATEATPPVPAEEPGAEEQPEAATSTSTGVAEERDPVDVLTRILPHVEHHLRRLSVESPFEAREWAKRIHTAVDKVMAELPPDEDEGEFDT